MSISRFNGFNKVDGIIGLGNRSDKCYLCERKIHNESKSPDEAFQKTRELIGKLEGKKVVKLMRNGSETVICLECVHEITEKHPLEEKVNEQAE